MEEHNVVHPYTRILFDSIKEQIVDMSCLMNKPRKCYFKWMQLNIREYILYDSIYVKFPEETVYRVDQWLPGVRQIGMKKLLGVMETF